MNLLDYESSWCPSGAHLLECVSSPSMKVDGGIDCYFLGWPGGSVIARIPTVLVVGGRSSMASGANCSPSRERKNGTVLQFKNLAPRSAR